MSVRPAKTQITLGIRPVWSEASLCAQWVAKDPSFLHADSEDSDQTGRIRPVWSESLLGVQPLCWFCHVATLLFEYMRFPKIDIIIYINTPIQYLAKRINKYIIPNEHLMLSQRSFGLNPFIVIPFDSVIPVKTYYYNSLLWVRLTAEN